MCWDPSRQKERRQTPELQAPNEIRLFESLQVLPDHRGEPQIGVPSRQCVAEPSGCLQRGGARGYDSGASKVIRRDLQNFRWVAQALNFVQNNALPIYTAE